MARWNPARAVPDRADVIGEVAAEVLHNFPRGRIIVGVDGRVGAGTARFAADLAAAFTSRGVRSVSLSLDAFQHDAATRTEGSDDRGRDDERRDDERRYDERRYDDAAFRSRAIEPFRRGAPVALEHRSRATGAVVRDPITWLPETNSVLVVEGSLLHRPEIVGIWHSSLWLDVSRARSIACAVERNGADDEAKHPFADADDAYIAAVDPRRRAFANFDMSDAAHPRRTFADSC